MLGFIEYLKTFNHLDIGDQDRILNERDLEKIIQGKVIEKNSDKKRKSADSVLVVSSNTLETSTQKTAFEYSKDFSWMGHFNKNNSSELVVAKDGGYYSYVFGNTNFGRNTIVVSRTQRMWLGEGHFYLQEFAHTRPLLANVSYEEIYNIIRNNYVDAKTIIR